MSSFASLHKRLTKAGLSGNMESEIEAIKQSGDCDEHHLDCLLNPQKQPPVMRLNACSCTEEERDNCQTSCFFDAIKVGEDGNAVIDNENCTGCGDCIGNCPPGNLTDRKEIVPILNLLNAEDSPVYAMIAPAYIGQFSEQVSPGKLRTAFKKLGFAGLIEVALFADILTLKEALEFDSAIQSDKDYMLTSCCCPLWIAMIKKIYNKLVPHLPPSVSPMAACGRSIKILYPQAKTVFIGPCIAKKAESRNKDIADAVDFVLTFEEMQDIFELAGIVPKEQGEDKRDHSSTAGRIYARTSGVSEAVKSTVQRLRPNRSIPLKAAHADGVPACKQLLKNITDGNLSANFIEGMGCEGGCVGGPKSLLDVEQATSNVNEYGGGAEYLTPVDNPYVIELLERLGFNTIESLTKGDNIFTRKFE
ncbi:MAG: iron hydrogenase [Clostridia bacterium]|nr:iron hydrogenase [Clostridia bacterium]